MDLKDEIGHLLLLMDHGYYNRSETLTKIMSLLAENTAGVSGSSTEFDDLHDVGECNATRVDIDADSLEPVEDRLEKITEPERAECRNPLGCACKEANGYPLTDCSYWW